MRDVGETTQGAPDPSAQDREPEVLPLSFGQRRLWFLFRLEGASATYNVPVVTRVRGVVDVGALRAAVGDVVGRHEVLRSVYREVDGEPVQCVLEGVEVPFVHARVGVGEVDAAVESACSRVFDLEREVPVAVELLSVADDDHRLVVTIHHIAADGVSMGPLSADLSVAYEARCAGRSPGWEALPVQYGDFALWQQDLLGSGSGSGSGSVERDRLVRFWSGALEGVPVELALPVDRVRPVRSSYRGGRVVFEVSAGTHAGLVGLARSVDASLFMVVQAGLAALLTRLGCGVDVPLGTVVAGRTDEQLKDLVGFFVNSLVLRTDTSGDPSFVELVGRVRGVDLAAFDHAELPFEQLVEVLSPPRSLARHPLFQVFLQMAADEYESRPPLFAEPVPFELAVAKFDLSFYVTAKPEEGGLLVAAEYASDLFDESTVAAVCRAFVDTLDEVVGDPTVRIGDLSRPLPARLAPPDSTWSRGHAGEHEDVVAAILGRRSGSPLLTRTRTLDRGGFVDLVGSVAERLTAGGVHPGDHVAVRIGDRLDNLAVLLAVLSLDGVAVQVDPTAPAERQRYMIEDSASGWVVDGLDDEGLTAVPASTTAPAARGAAAPAAGYILYTSGSTGAPKGVLVGTDSLSNLAADVTRRLDLSDRATVLSLARPSFDVSLGETLPALLVGARLVLVSQQEAGDLSLCAELVRRHDVTHVVATPTQLRHLLTLDPTLLEGRFVVATGEELPPGVARDVSATASGLVNLYGPTEATVWATGGEVGPDTGPPDIGRPLDNVEVHVLDAGLRPVAIGGTGEIFLGGQCLAHGYWRRPALTAERFVAHPLGDGTRLYRTGDVGRWTASGRLQYLGREDGQVKIRGLRVELGEIASALRDCDGVADAYVSVRRNGEDTALVAHVLPKDGAAPTPEVLRRSVSTRLPGYMVPRAVVVVDSLPRTSNGKIDTAALPAPVEDAGEGRPETDLQRLLADCFAYALGIPTVGTGTNFFDAGGHSLSAALLAARLSERLGRKVSVARVFENPSVLSMESWLEGDQDAAITGSVVSFRSAGTGRPVVLVPPVNGLPWAYSDLSRAIDGDREVLGLVDPRHGRDTAPRSTVQEIAAALVRCVPDDVARQRPLLVGWSFGGVLAYEMGVLLQAAGRPADRVVLLDSRIASLEAITPTSVDILWAAVDGAIERDRLVDVTDRVLLDELELRGSPLADLGLEGMARLRALSETNAHCLAHYRPTPSDLTVHVFEAVEGRPPGVQGLRDQWSRFTTGTLTVDPVHCDHVQIGRSPYVDQLDINRWLGDEPLGKDPR
ncbi:amino acid adenylation domain-containing protein [Terracoccus luteus]|uniref:Amino acid adenylation domain-containing protein n=1 Tax=Terracoccus luteus TaxID=53356 RepID=A0A495XY45_9MICO|nr:amino acid adenylation domain-containing protein [Terracoccus luteus]